MVIYMRRDRFVNDDKLNRPTEDVFIHSIIHNKQRNIKKKKIRDEKMLPKNSDQFSILPIFPIQFTLVQV